MIDLTTLSEEEKAVILAKRAYKRAWNAKNKDKVKAINDRFYKKQAHHDSWWHEEKEKALVTVGFFS